MKIKCMFGFHNPNHDWGLKWSSKVYYCKCKTCGRVLVWGRHGSFSSSEFYRRF